MGVSGDVIVVGAKFNYNALGNNSGAIYIFDEIAGVWTETAKLTASNGLAFTSGVIIAVGL